MKLPDLQNRPATVSIVFLLVAAAFVRDGVLDSILRIRLPYDYYRLLRWVVAASAGFMAYRSHQAGERGWTFGLVAICALFNPLVPVQLDRWFTGSRVQRSKEASQLWAMIDIWVAIAFGAWMFGSHDPSARLGRRARSSALSTHEASSAAQEGDYGDTGEE